MYSVNQVIQSSKTVLEALKLIDINKKGFLIVVDVQDKLVGTITDGDIRRIILAGRSTNEKVSDVIKPICKKITLNNSVGDAIDLFKNESIKFLPIVDKDNKLVNIITKRQLHCMLLLDIQEELDYDFASLDENIVDYEIFSRPWGFYKTTAMNQYFQSKVITVKPNSRLSLQSHERREEHWIVANGRGTVQIDQSFIDVRSGSSIFIPKGAKHRLINTDENETLIITEVQIGDYFGEDDIHRYEDDYGRI